jgi:hypothetical protein
MKVQNDILSCESIGALYLAFNASLNVNKHIFVRGSELAVAYVMDSRELDTCRPAVPSFRKEARLITQT